MFWEILILPPNNSYYQRNTSRTSGSLPSTVDKWSHCIPHYIWHSFCSYLCFTDEETEACRGEGLPCRWDQFSSTKLPWLKALTAVNGSSWKDRADSGDGDVFSPSVPSLTPYPFPLLWQPHVTRDNGIPRPCTDAHITGQCLFVGPWPGFHFSDSPSKPSSSSGLHTTPFLLMKKIEGIRQGLPICHSRPANKLRLLLLALPLEGMFHNPLVILFCRFHPSQKFLPAPHHCMSVVPALIRSRLDHCHTEHTGVLSLASPCTTPSCPSATQLFTAYTPGRLLAARPQTLQQRQQCLSGSVWSRRRLWISLCGPRGAPYVPGMGTLLHPFLALSHSCPFALFYSVFQLVKSDPSLEAQLN